MDHMRSKVQIPEALDRPDLDARLNYSELLTVEDVAAGLKVRSGWVYRHAEELGVYRVGKYLRFEWGLY